MIIEHASASNRALTDHYSGWRRACPRIHSRRSYWTCHALLFAQNHDQTRGSLRDDEALSRMATHRPPSPLNRKRHVYPIRNSPYLCDSWRGNLSNQLAERLGVPITVYSIELVMKLCELCTVWIKYSTFRCWPNSFNRVSNKEKNILDHQKRNWFTASYILIRQCAITLKHLHTIVVALLVNNISNKLQHKSLYLLDFWKICENKSTQAKDLWFSNKITVTSIRNPKRTDQFEILLTF